MKTEANVYGAAAAWWWEIIFKHELTQTRVASDRGFRVKSAAARDLKRTVEALCKAVR